MMYKLTFGWVLFLITTGLSGQTFLTDTAFISDAMSSAREVYTDRMKDNIHLYDGSDYRVYTGKGDQHPYYTRDWSEGSVFYNGNLYTGEEMLYDMGKDRVIIQSFYGGSFIELVPEKIDYFLLEDHKFVHVNEPTLKVGYYDLRVDGKIKFYIKRSKEFKQVIVYNDLVDEFNEINKYYLFRNNTFYPIKNKRSVRVVLSDFEDALNPYIRDERFQFRKNFENSVLKIVQFCNAL